ncbi:MAG: HAMP domain-containing protein [Alphaproteobacteria bacterium]|nr:HAMP domain-containing protein [Alphaproteobacteria bacterium]
MKTRPDGFPIAAHIAVLIIVALIAAFVVSVAALAFLPTRPPDLARSDQVLDAFAAGYARAALGETPDDAEGLRWRVIETPPPQRGAPPPARHLRRLVSDRLNISRDDIRVSGRGLPGDMVMRVERRGPGHGGHGEHMVVRTWRIPAPPAPPAPPLTQDGDAPIAAPLPPRVFLLAGFEIAAKLPEGRWAVMRQSQRAEEFAWIVRGAVTIGLTLLVVTALALLFARRLAQPIRTFAETAQRIGVDPDYSPAKIEGPRELRVAASAVNAMQERLRKLIADRTETLAAVAHDMRTPLMRLSLSAENTDDETRAKLRKDIEEIEALVASFIAFARDDPTQEPRVRLDLSALVQALVDDRVELGQVVQLSADDRILIMGQPLGLRRMTANLIDNALKHGGNADVRVYLDGENAIIDVCDDGPGVPPERREDVFKPFVRLNETATRGAGLGLPAARSIARAHGGDVVIVDREGGACVRATLPL